MPKKLSRDSYRVGWICPLEVEEIAAIKMLDEKHHGLSQLNGDTNVYNLGSINNHNVVIAGLPRAGNCSAATVVTQMRMTFPNLKYSLLVGIGGGVPVKTDSGMIRLGHVVVSEPTGIHSGVIQYDHGKAKVGYFERKGSLAPPPTALLNAAREVAIRRYRIDYDPIWKNLERIQTSCPIHLFKFPGAANDHLYPSDYLHGQKGIRCEDSGCDPKQRIKRPTDAEDDSIVIHRGTIASGESMIEDAKKRDDLARKYGVLCFETEAVGALIDFPCLVIRGISDYCDSHKNDQWQGYAAAVAAAYARQLFFHMPIEEVQRNPNPTPTTFELPFNLSEISEVTRFIAREDQLKEIRTILDAAVGRRTAVVHGLGGIGKTQLAIAYIKRYRSDYSAAIWLNALDETALKQSFARAAEWILRHYPSITYIAGALENRDLDETVKAVKRWLDEPMNDRWLVVYDNYDNPLLGNHTGESLKHTSCIEAGAYGDDDGDLAKAFDLQTFLPETDHGAILVTTRSSMVKLGQRVPLHKLEDINDSLDVLASASGREDLKQEPAATDLARQLDGLPLALATAGAYLEQVSISCTEYLQLYRGSWQLLHEATPQLPAYHQTLYSTWNLSYRYIQRQSPTAAMLLRQWAYFASEDLWYELLADSGPEKPEWLGALTENKLTFHASLRLLCSYGLVEADPTTILHRVESRGYSVHGCVHSWMIHVLNQGLDKKMAWTAVECIAAHVPGEDKPEFWLMHRRLIAHADRSLETLRNIEVEDEAAGVLHSLGRLYGNQGRLKEAEAMFERAREGKEKVLGQEHTSTLDTINNLGLIYTDQGRLKEAEAIYKRALEGKEKAWGRDHTSTLSTVHNLGNLYRNQGRLQEAEVTYERALKGYEKALGREHTSTLDTVNNLGLLYVDQGRLQAAEAMYERALEGKEKVWGRDHISTLSTVNNLGNLYKSQGRLQEAEAMYEQALEGKEKVWGRDHISTLSTVNNLGSLYNKQGQREEAEAMYQRALEGMEKAWGREHISTLDTVNNLGLLYTDQGRLQEAELMLRRALKGYEKVLGAEHISTLNTVNNLGNLYANQGWPQDAEAEAMYERALEGYEKALGREHISTLDTVNNLGLLYTDQGRLQEAEPMYKRALEGKEKVWGREHTSTLSTVNSLGNLYKNQGRLQEAEAMYQRVLKGYEKTLGPTSLLTYIPALNMLENFALLCEEQGNVVSALIYYRQALDGAETVFGGQSQRDKSPFELEQQSWRPNGGN
ncbi:Disease resistance protein [Penicillium canariense]|uniref:Disease resistance protein n=1 Tax=Penicillium canariense TaxID=189055 RepID=A0A9W9HZQ1_9EURO|nr:Disease resistance protein [Penicillium canariense]KAJ5160437.1 Disease resistance protein [Penicillium canariense]